MSVASQVSALAARVATEVNTVRGGLAARPRAVTVDTAAAVGDALWVDATTGPVTITPPAGAAAGGRVFVAKVDDSGNAVTWSGTVNADPQGVELVSPEVAVTLLHDGTGWWIESVSTATSAGGGGGSVAWADITGKPAFAAVATTGDYTDLTGRPAIPDSPDDIAAAPAADPTLSGLVTFDGARVDTPHPLTDTATITVDAAAGGLHLVTLAADRALAVPTGGVDGQQLRVVAHASGADRDLTLDGAYLLTTGIPNPVTVPAGKRAFLGLHNITGVGWVVLAAAVQA